MNEYIDNLIERHAPNDPYLMKRPQAAAAIREAMAAQREACSYVYQLCMEARQEWQLSYTVTVDAGGIDDDMSAIINARVEGDE